MAPNPSNPWRSWQQQPTSSSTQPLHPQMGPNMPPRSSTPPWHPTSSLFFIKIHPSTDPGESLCFHKPNFLELLLVVYMWMLPDPRTPLCFPKKMRVTSTRSNSLCYSSKIRFWFTVIFNLYAMRPTHPRNSYFFPTKMHVAATPHSRCVSWSKSVLGSMCGCDFICDAANPVRIPCVFSKEKVPHRNGLTFLGQVIANVFVMRPIPPNFIKTDQDVRSAPLEQPLFEKKIGEHHSF